MINSLMHLMPCIKKIFYRRGFILIYHHILSVIFSVIKPVICALYPFFYITIGISLCATPIVMIYLSSAVYKYIQSFSISLLNFLILHVCCRIPLCIRNSSPPHLEITQLLHIFFHLLCNEI